MTRIIKDEELLIAVNFPRYIRLHRNGSYVQCDEKEAEGVAVAGTPYHIIGRPAMKGTEEDVLLNEVDEAGERIREAEEEEDRKTALEMAIADLTMLIAGGGLNV